ncbi:hypothetical protein LH464_01680 [Neorhizobium sp. T786]|uniref:hypothetical protein n=1 Tax=Pseudorhizobium xiangyangii TaxID=2883104 RepID=UPI001D000C26|nr:hypothetical protein [Neorhizobium xiangyangii]MCB5201185.1 hypothetical protein [Neorhizobium xiangyangii]
MSELQNRAVRMLQQESLNMTVSDHRFQMLKVALALYRSSGGSERMARDLCAEAFKEPRKDIAAGIGEIMIVLAGISHLNDLDMMQAAYNELERGLPELA